MMNEIENLRGTEVLEFGQPKQMQAEFDPLIIDTVGILEELEGHEVSSLAVFDPETDEEIYFDNASEYLDYMDEVYGLEELSHDNTFNYNSPISNQIDYQVYKDDYKVLTIFMKLFLMQVIKRSSLRLVGMNLQPKLMR